MADALSRPILLTGFEPFGDFETNSSWEGARLLAGRRSNRIMALRLPVDHDAAAAMIAAAIAEHRPAIALLTGLSPEPRCRLERRARRPKPEDVSAWPDGPSERFGAWPWERSRAAMAEALSGGETQARFSDNCGRYVCETGYRALLDLRAEGRAPELRLAAFLHVPPLSERWTAEAAATAMEAALSAAEAMLAAGRS